jgi:hypothetical protein
MFRISNTSKTSSPEYYLRYIQEYGSPSIILFDGVTTWTGAVDIDMKSDKDKEIIRKSLTNWSKSMIYILDDDKLYIKRSTGIGSGVETKVAISLTREPGFDMKEFTYLYQRIQVNQTTKTLDDEKQKERNKLIQDNRDLIKERNEIRTTMGNQFVQILNEKKAKIRDLLAEIELLKKSNTGGKRPNLSLDTLDED